MHGFLHRKVKRWDFVWEFPDGTLVELRADDPMMVDFEKKKNDLRSLLKKERISSGEYVERFRSLCVKLGSRLEKLPPGYFLSKEYSVAKVYSRTGGLRDTQGRIHS